MHHAGLRKLILLCFAVTFAVLLISGAPRLIASEDSVYEAVQIRPIPTYLCSSSASRQHSGHSLHDEHVRSDHRWNVTLFFAHTGMHEVPDLFADANGNVLTGMSYMRSVYQVFALGDGFA